MKKTIVDSEVNSEENCYFKSLLEKMKAFPTDDYRERKSLEELFFSNAPYEEFKKHSVKILVENFTSSVGSAVKTAAVILPNIGEMVKELENSESLKHVRRCW